MINSKMQTLDMKEILTPRRTHEAIITVSSNSWEEFLEALNRCVREVKSKLGTGSSGGGLSCTNWHADYINTETSEEKYREDWNILNKIRHTDKVHFCIECKKFGNKE